MFLGGNEVFTNERHHHEIYLSDPRKVAQEKCKTVIRHPIKKIVNVNQNIFIDPFMIIAYNIDEQDYLLDLSALLL